MPATRAYAGRRNFVTCFDDPTGDSVYPYTFMRVECSTCGAVLEFTTERARICPYCLNPSVLERPESEDRPNPEFAVAFTITQQAARAAVRRWARGQSIFTHGGLLTASLDDVRGVYLPAYLYSALCRAQFAASIGENYTETETYTTTDANGRTTTHTRTVTHTEHRPLQGEHVAYVTDVLVTASRAIKNAELEGVEPFDFRALRRYTPALISGWIAEDPSLSREACLELSRGEAATHAGRKLEAFMPGDSHSNLRFQARVEQESLELVLIPLWVFALRYDPKKPPARVLVNGQTGAVHGFAPKSAVRIAVAIAIGVALVVALYLWAHLSGGRR